jgi:hypothetical protein
MRHEVTFHPVKPMFSSALEFVRKGEVHMLETGLLADGALLLVKIPFIGGFYSQMLSERTTRTVPYSQIVSHRFSGQWMSMNIVKGFFLLLLLLLLAAAIFTAMGSQDGFYPGLFASCVCVLMIVVTMLSGRRRHLIRFRLPSGKTSQMTFVLNRPTTIANKAFADQLSRYTAAARQFKGQES